MLAAPVGAVVVAGFEAGAIGHVLPAMRLATGADAQQSSWLLTVFVAATLLAVPLAAVAARRHDPARLLRLGVAGAALAALLAALAPGLGTVLAARTLQGLAQGPLLPLAASVVVLHAPLPHQGRWLGVLSLAYGLAYLAAMVGTPFLLHAGWRAGFAATAMLAGLTALLPLPPGGGHRPARPAGSAWRVLLVRPMAPVAALAAGNGLAQAVVVWMPTVAAVRLGLAPAETALAMLALVIGGFAATTWVTLKLDRLGARTPVVAGALAAAGGGVLAAWGPAVLPVFTVAAAALGFGVGAISSGPLRYAAARALPPGEQGPAQGAVAWLINAGLLGGSLLLGALAAQGGDARAATERALGAAALLMALSFLPAGALPQRGAPAETH